MKKTILIFGISSFVGSNLAEILKDDFRIIGTYHKTPVNIPGVLCVPCDVLKKEYVTSLVTLFKPDFTIYAAGMSSLKEASLYPKNNDALNTAGLINCCTACERGGSKFIFLSSSFVFGGEDILYREGDTPFPTTALGNALSSSEFYVQRSCLNYFILRSSPLYGRAFNPLRPNWFEVVQSKLAKNEAVKADDSIVTGFLDIYLVGKILKSAIEANVTNRLFQVSSRDFMTRYEFAKLYAKVFKEDENLIQNVNFNFPIESGKNNKLERHSFKLDLNNIEEFLGQKMPTVEESLLYTYKRFQSKN